MPHSIRSTDGRANQASPVPLFFRFRTVIKIALSVILILAAAAVSLKTVPALRIKNDDGQTLALIKIPDGGFVHHYVHTINLSPVDEYFQIEEDGRLRLYELRYDTNSVGMPSDSELGLKLEGGRFVLAMNRMFDKIPLRVSIRPEHGLIANGEYLPFSKWSRPMGPLVLTGENIVSIRWWR